MKKITLLLSFVFLVSTSFSNLNAYGIFTDGTYVKTSKLAAASVKTSKDSYEENEPITVIFSGLTGNNADWITLIKPDAPAREYGNWKYAKGETSGSLTFDAMKVGDYEVRAFFSTGYTIQARYPFKVTKSTKVLTVEETINKSPARNYISSLTERLDKLENLKNSPKWGDEMTMRNYTSFLKTAGIHLKSVVSADPNFDVSGYKKRLEDYQTYYDNNVGKANDNNMAKADFEKLMKDKSWQLTNLMDNRLGSGAVWAHTNFNIPKYFKDAKGMGYPELLKAATEGDSKFKGHTVGHMVTTVKEFSAAYKSYYNETLDKVINGLIEGAYENKTKDAQEAIKYAEQAKQLSDAAMLILPNDAAIKEANKEAKATLDKVGGAILSKIYTSGFHKDNAAKIVFFSKKPTIKSENPSTVKSAYKAGDFIYAMAYLKGSFKDLTKSTNNINVTTNILVDGSKKTSHTFVMDYATLQKGATYAFMEIVPDPATNIHSGPAKYAAELATISPRNHTIKVTFEGMQGGTSMMIPFAEGEFSLDCSTGQDKLAAYAAKYRDKSLADVYMPKASKKDAGLVSSMKKALTDEGWEKDKKVQRVVITGSDWEIHKHPVDGYILYRSIPAAAAFKTNVGFCKYWNLTFKQAYDGSKYGKTVVGGVGSIVDLSCKNVMK